MQIADKMEDRKRWYTINKILVTLPRVNIERGKIR